MSEKTVIRAGTVAVTVASVVLAASMGVPQALPSAAMGSALLLYFERLAIVLAVLLFLLVFVYRGLLRGELPTAVSGRGAQWQDLGIATSSAEVLQAEMDAIKRQLEALEEDVAAIVRS